MSEKEFEFPSVEVGDVVLFMGSIGGEKSFPMIVDSVGDSTVDGAVWNAENNTWEQRNGCRHADDPWLKDPFNANVINEESDTGVFIISPTVRELRRNVSDLTLSVEACLELLRKGGKEPDKAIAAAATKKAKAAAAKKSEGTGGPVSLNDIIGLKAPQPKLEAAGVGEDD